MIQIWATDPYPGQAQVWCQHLIGKSTRDKPLHNIVCTKLYHKIKRMSQSSHTGKVMCSRRSSILTCSSMQLRPMQFCSNANLQTTIRLKVLNMCMETNPPQPLADPPSSLPSEALFDEIHHPIFLYISHCVSDVVCKAAWSADCYTHRPDLLLNLILHDEVDVWSTGEHLYSI